MLAIFLRGVCGPSPASWSVKRLRQASWARIWPPRLSRRADPRAEIPRRNRWANRMLANFVWACFASRRRHCGREARPELRISHLASATAPTFLFKVLARGSGQTECWPFFVGRLRVPGCALRLRSAAEAVRSSFTLSPRFRFGLRFHAYAEGRLCRQSSHFWLIPSRFSASSWLAFPSFTRTCRSLDWEP